jgi:hypothetical protein
MNGTIWHGQCMPYEYFFWGSSIFGRASHAKESISWRDILPSSMPSHRQKGHLPICFVSDDCCLKIWDMRVRKEVSSFKDKFQLLSNQIISGRIENFIKLLDLRKNVLEWLIITPTLLACLSLRTHLKSFLSLIRICYVCSFLITLLPRIDVSWHSMDTTSWNNLLLCNWSPDFNVISVPFYERQLLSYYKVNCTV